MTVKNFINRVCTVAAICFMLNYCAVNSEAYRVQLNENGNFIAEGGINEYDGVTASDYESTLELEAMLRNNGYILINTDSMDITREELENFQTQGFWFSEYIRPDEIFYWTKYKIYVYEPSFRDYMNELEEDGCIADYTRIEIDTGTVVLSYAYWYSKDKAGTVCCEFNNNIPEWFTSGYVEIRSPIDTEIKFWLPVEDTYYVFYISADTPFLVKMKTGGYNIIDVNAHKFEDREPTIVNKNMLHISEENTIDNPYVIELRNLVETYKIESMDISGQPDYSIEQNQNIAEHKVVVSDTEDDTASGEKKKNIAAFCILAVIIGLFGLITAIHWYERKREDNDS